MKHLLSSQTKTYLTVFTSLGVILILFFLFYKIMQPFLFIFFGAFIISVFVNPLYNYMCLKLNMSRKTAAILVILFFVLIITIPSSIIVSFLIVEISDAIHFLQNNSGIIGNFVNSISVLTRELGIYPRNLDAEVSRYLTNFLSVFLSNLTAVLSLTAGFLFNSFFALIIVYYLLISKEKIESFFNRFNTLDREHSTRLVNRAEEIINATVRGSIAIMISQFFLSLVGFLLFGIKSPFLFASLYGALSIIPGVGIALIWVPLAVTLLIAGNFFSCVAIIVWCLSTNFLMDNFVSPRIFAANAKLHPLLILFGVLGGIQLYGFLGIILGPTIIALSFVAVDMLSEIFNA